MTREEANKIVAACDEWIDLEPYAPDWVNLDGTFTAQELEAVLTLMRLSADQP